MQNKQFIILVSSHILTLEIRWLFHSKPELLNSVYKCPQVHIQKEITSFNYWGNSLTEWDFLYLSASFCSECSFFLSCTADADVGGAVKKTRKV